MSSSGEDVEGGYGGRGGDEEVVLSSDDEEVASEEDHGVSEAEVEDDDDGDEEEEEEGEEEEVADPETETEDVEEEEEEVEQETGVQGSDPESDGEVEPEEMAQEEEGEEQESEPTEPMESATTEDEPEPALDDQRQQQPATGSSFSAFFSGLGVAAEDIPAELQSAIVDKWKQLRTELDQSRLREVGDPNRENLGKVFSCLTSFPLFFSQSRMNRVSIITKNYLALGSHALRHNIRLG